MIYTKQIVLLSFLLSLTAGMAQYKQGKIIYERKTNMFKRYGENAKRWLDEKDRIKVEYFELIFNDTASLWQIEARSAGETSWGTSRNVVYRNTSTNRYYSIRDIWGDMIHVEDELPLINWKVTESKRTIAGFDCRKVIWKANDTTTIYAWYCDEIIPSIGPERFYGLPGAILGLASEDGGVVYFAKEVKFYAPKREELEIKRNKKTQPLESIREQVELNMSRNKYWKTDISHYFLW
jgi:GLPGLI family protein